MVTAKSISLNIHLQIFVHVKKTFKFYSLSNFQI